jgi:mono/diheme cytochrome c family protein
MRRALRWLRNALIGLFALVAIALLVAYVVSERELGRRFSAEPADISASLDSASVAEGFHIAQTRGCTGCHGANLQGQTFIDDPLMARVASPNLTIAAAEYSDGQLAHIIRRGVRPDGQSLVIMPSGSFSQLTDRDVGSILAYLHSVPGVEGQRRTRYFGPVARILFALGKFKPAPVEAREADALAPSYPQPGQPHWKGAYIARTTCTECHGLNLAGGSGKRPDLRIAAGYTLEQFTHFMRTGKALGDRELPLMSDMARRRFSHFTDDELAELHGYLVARAGR